MNRSTLLKIISVIGVLVLLAVALAFFKKPPTKNGQVFTINTNDQPTMGKIDAGVQIVVFEDLKCIACKTFNNTVLPLIKKEYIDTGAAKYTVINLAFIPGSMPAANAARCLYKENPDWFFAFVDHVYQNQPPETEDWATIPKLVEFASAIPGVNPEKLSHCIYDSPYTDFILKNFEQARQLQGPSVSTPAVYVNGHFVEEPSALHVKKAIASEK